jgi:5'(3')-deoxyribonucleotidase
MKRAGVDIDGVLYDWDARCRELIGCFWGVEIPERSTSYYAVRDLLRAQLGRATGDLAWNWLFTAPARSAGLWLDGPTVPGALDGLRRLQCHFEVAIITKRPRVALPDTFRWFADTLRFTPDALVVLGPESGSKGQIPCAWYVDDSEAIVEDLATFHPEAPVYLFDQPWNQDAKVGTRVADWDALLRKVIKG